MSVESSLEMLNNTIAEFVRETKESLKETEMRIKETDKSLKETDKILTEKFKETDKQFKETDKKLKEVIELFKERDKEIDKLLKQTSMFESRWGKFIEAMVDPAVVKIFRERGIELTGTHRRVEKKCKAGREIEIDILSVNTDSVIPIEVKTTLKVEDVREHIEKRLKEFRSFFPEYKDKKVYGGIGYINVEEDADKYAFRNGLFVLSLTGDNLIEIKNSKDFMPREF